MTCTRTGAHIWLEPYGEWLYGDAFEVAPRLTGEGSLINLRVRMHGAKVGVENVAYFQVAARSFKPINGLTVKHYTIEDYDYWSNQGDVEQELRASMIVTNNFVNHGYYGEPIDVS